MSRNAQAFFAVAVLLCSATAPVLAAVRPSATIASDSATVWWTPTTATVGLALAVGAPDGSVQTSSFAGNEQPTLSLIDDDGQPLADGPYTWELRMRLPAARRTSTSQASSED